MSLELFPGKHLFLDDFRIEELTAVRGVPADTPPGKSRESHIRRLLTQRPAPS